MSDHLAEAPPVPDPPDEPDTDEDPKPASEDLFVVHKDVLQSMYNLLTTRVQATFAEIEPLVRELQLSRSLDEYL